MNAADTAYTYELLCSRPADYLKAEWKTLLRSLTASKRAAAMEAGHDGSDPFGVFHTEALVATRAKMEALDVKGDAGIVLALRLLVD